MDTRTQPKQIEDEPLEQAVLHRHLGDPIYRIRRFGLMLTDMEIAFSFGVAWAAWTLVYFFGLGQVGIFRSKVLTLDPWAFIATLAAMLWGISVLHMVRPEATLQTWLTGGGNAKHFAPSMPDKRWTPGKGRIAQWNA